MTAEMISQTRGGVRRPGPTNPTVYDRRGTLRILIGGHRPPLQNTVWAPRDSTGSGGLSLHRARKQAPMPALLRVAVLSHLSGKSRAKCARFRNPKSEVQNPKQVKNTNTEIFKRSEGPIFFFGCFDFSSIVSDCLMSVCGLGTGFEIRISRRSSWFRLRRVGRIPKAFPLASSSTAAAHSGNG